MLERLGVELELRGNPALAGPLLLVANHISWLDIIVLHAARHCRFVSKANVRHWPIIGSLATGAGTLYVERESRRDAMRVVHRMVAALQAGDVLAVFPEGTTGDGSRSCPSTPISCRPLCPPTRRSSRWRCNTSRAARWPI